ncbi:MAG: polysaccharide biosynthesis protein GtrA, partial [Lawsonibacter sp.]|nr:polysaccharide biosynthesis protein GtrA [Lawsonibacter sp.]
QLSLSTALVYLAELAFAISAPALSTLVKVLVDTILFFFSFRIQHKWVFNSEK